MRDGEQYGWKNLGAKSLGEEWSDGRAACFWVSSNQNCLIKMLGNEAIKKNQ